MTLRVKKIPKDERFKTCEYCRFYNGIYCEKHIRRNRVLECCAYFEFAEERVKGGF